MNKKNYILIKSDNKKLNKFIEFSFQNINLNDKKEENMGLVKITKKTNSLIFHHKIEKTQLKGNNNKKQELQNKKNLKNNFENFSINNNNNNNNKTTNDNVKNININNVVNTEDEELEKIINSFF